MRRVIVIAAGLVVLTLAVYWQTVHHEFITFDDPQYVYENPHVTSGLSKDDVVWAFTTNEQANWHPLVWLSLMLDTEVHGSDARGFHLTNLLLHTVNGLLLFAALSWMTGAAWKSGFVAALFAVHPLHVESVAWVASRKDLLSTLFGLLALIGYLAWVRRRQARWYLLALVAFACSLMSKQMLVTLPFVLLLLDYWPLRRAGTESSGTGTRSWGSLIVEKLPLFAIAFAFSVVAYLVQHRGGAVQDFETYPVGIRLLNAVWVYLLYAMRTAWPQGLAVFYPHPGSAISIPMVLGAGALLAAVSLVVIRQARRRPYLPVGWAWYLGTLVPVIGLVQLAGHQMADRYTYIPIVGLFIAATWLVPSLAPPGLVRERVIPLLAGALLLVYASAGWYHARYWLNTETLFGRALSVARENAVAHSHLGSYFGQRGRLDESIRHLERAVAMSPHIAGFHSDLGGALQLSDRPEEAIFHFKRALEIDPTEVAARMNWGHTLDELGRPFEAVAQYEAALEIEPGHPRIRDTLVTLQRRLGRELAGQEQFDPAVQQFRGVLRLQPDDWLASYDLAVGLYLAGNLDEARTHYERALEIQPDLAQLHNELGLLLLDLGEREAAARHFREVLRLQPESASARENLRRATEE